MTQPQLLHGPVVRDYVFQALESDIKKVVDQGAPLPGLAVILVGDDPASQVYVASKHRACQQLGMHSFEHKLPADTSEETLAQLITSLNQDSSVDGILLQLPLPKHLNADRMIQLIDPSKDVDGLHPVNIGKVLIGLPSLQSCTPSGVCELMSYYNIDPSGQHVVIIGRSNLVGKPLAAKLMQKSKIGNATVTVCHSRTKDLSKIASTADILVAAIGIPHYVTQDMIKPGAVVIDVGINRVDDPQSTKGYRLVGDVHFDAVHSKVSAITPVPGGVGPMTIAMLMKNTMIAYRNHQSIQQPTSA